MSSNASLRLVTRALENDPHPGFYWNYTPNLIQFSDAADAPPPITATHKDMKALDAAGLIELGEFSLGGNKCFAQVLPAAFQAVTDNFGMRKRDIVTRAIYDEAEGQPGVYVTSGAIAARSGLSLSEIDTAAALLIGDGLVYRQPKFLDLEAMPTRAEGKDELALTPTGVAFIEDPKTDAGPIRSTVTYQKFYAPVGAVHSGHGNIAIDTQPVGLSGSELADLINKLRSLLPSLPPERRAEAAEHLDDLESELKAPMPKQSRIEAFLLALWKHGKDAAEFTAHLAQIATAYGADFLDN